MMRRLKSELKEDYDKTLKTSSSLRMKNEGHGFKTCAIVCMGVCVWVCVCGCVGVGLCGCVGGCVLVSGCACVTFFEKK